MQKREIPLITDVVAKNTGDWSVDFNFTGCVVWFFKNLGYTVTKIEILSTKRSAKVTMLDSKTGEVKDMTFLIADFTMGFTSLMENCLKSVIES